MSRIECRDCADFGPVCPYDDLPCERKEMPKWAKDANAYAKEFQCELEKSSIKNTQKKDRR